MAENTITGLVPDIYEALDVVSRELTGFIPAVSMNASAQTAQVGQNIRVDVEPEGNSGNITPAMTPPEPTGQTSGYVDIQVTKSKYAEFGFNGEDQKGLNTGAGYTNVRAGKIAQAIRKLTNEVEADLAGLHTTASRAYGAAGTTPFATAGDLTDASNVLKILKDNGAPTSDNQLVIDTTAGAKFLGLQGRADMTGTDSILNQGVLVDRFGMPIRESGQVKQFGTDGITANVTVTGVNAVGSTTINVTTDATGAVSFAAGDILTIAGDGEKYVVTTAATIGNSTTGDVVIAAPGLRKATAGSEAVSGVGSASRMMAFNRSALVLAARAPARPVEGDMADDVVMVTDPRSGLTMEFSMYKGYRKVRYEVALAWGVKNIKPEHTALLLG